MEVKQIHNLVDHVLAVKSLIGEDRKPYVIMEISANRQDIEIRIKDGGLDAEGPHDGVYTMDTRYGCDRVYNNCFNHLSDLETELKSSAQDGRAVC